MEKTIEKPSFGEFTTIKLDDDLIFNAERVGPYNFKGLREADYGQGFRMATLPELVPLIHSSLENKDYQTAKEVIKTLRNNWLTGNTSVLYTPKGMFVQDNPKMKEGRIYMDEKELESRLGSYQEKEVTFSDDRTIRFTPYEFKREAQSSLDLSKNSGIIALVNGEENAENLARSSEHYKIKPYFYALTNVDSPQIRVPGLGSGGFGYRLCIYAVVRESYDVRFSFGVSDVPKARAPKPKMSTSFGSKTWRL